MTADLLNRSLELEELNEELRKAHARAHEVAVTLQRAMLPSTTLPDRPGVAVRYRPATSFLNVCGDWYDLIDLDARRLAVAVGDVVGHGLEAAGTMGQLRSALSAAIRATGRPATALTTLAAHAHTVDGALAATAVQVVIDQTALTVTYSRAGHPPPLLAHGDGAVEVLDSATDPPLGAGDDSLPAARRRWATVPAAPSSSTPTVSSSAGARTSTPAWTASPTASNIIICSGPRPRRRRARRSRPRASARPRRRHRARRHPAVSRPVPDAPVLRSWGRTTWARPTGPA